MRTFALFFAALISSAIAATVAANSAAEGFAKGVTSSSSATAVCLDTINKIVSYLGGDEARVIISTKT